MASTPPVNEAFLREVDEELRRDEMKSLWDRYGKLAIGLLVGGLAVFGGWLLWQNYQRGLAGASGEALSGTIDQIAQGKTADAETALTPLAGSEKPAVAATAKLTQAGLALAKNDVKGAAALYGSIAADTKMPQAYRDLALVRQTAAEFDTLAPQAVVNRLKDVAVAGKPFFGSAGEMVGLAYLKMGKNDLAAATFAAIAKDEQVPEQIRTRVQQLTAGVSQAPAQPNGEGKK